MDVDERLRIQFLQLLDKNEWIPLETSAETRTRDPTLFGIEGLATQVGDSVDYLVQARAGKYGVALAIDYEYERLESDEPRLTSICILVCAVHYFEHRRKRAVDKKTGRITEKIEKRQQVFEKEYEFEANAINIGALVSEIAFDFNRDVTEGQLSADMVESLFYTELLDPGYLFGDN